MNKSVVVLAVPHQFQGSGFQGYMPNPTYEPLIRELIQRGHINFVFEEAGGRKPSIARELAESLLGPDRYLDVDPPPNEREKYGIPKTLGPKPLSISCESTIVDVQKERELVWKQRIENQPFENGLLICGLCHNLSIAFRLSPGIRVDRTYSFLPYSAFESED